MADSLHMALSNFRETMLTAIARLEFQVRDSNNFNYMTSNSNPCPSLTSTSPTMTGFEQTLGELMNRLEKLELKNTQIPVLSSIPTNTNPSELLKMESPLITKNLLVPSVKSTPALTAAVAAATGVSSHLSDFTLDSTTKDVVVLDDDSVISEEETEEIEEDTQEGDVEEEDINSSPELKQIIVKNKHYYMGSNNSVYQETDEGYEQIGMYDIHKDEVKLFGDESEEEVEEDDDEDAVEVEDFVFKGKTYQIDSDKNVYLDGEQIGIWNGKKIVALEA